MSTPKTWNLLNGIKTALARISTANGFHTDAGAAVTLEPAQVPATAGVVLAVALDAITQSDQAAFRAGQTGFAVTVVIVAKVDTALDDAQIRLHEIIEDVQAALGDARKDFGAQIRFPVFTEARPIVPEAGLNWIGAEIRYQSHIVRLPK